MKIVVIAPTFNEQGNISRLIHELEKQFQTLDHELHTLVVDANSSDGTSESIKQLALTHNNLHLLFQSSFGLGNAYIEGMTHAIKELNADAVFEMDADFSHDPADIPRLIKELENGADFVIGSRYVTGGSIPNNWHIFRKLNSRCGNIAARYIAGMTKIKDCTAGFRLIRTKLLQEIGLDNLNVRGYAFQVALLHKAYVAKAVIKEIPVHFIDRTYGESKLGARDIVEFLINIWWIRLQSSAVFIKFALVGLSGVIVNLGAFSLLMGLSLNKYFASPIAIELSIITNFLCHNYWTFKWRTNGHSLRVKGLKFKLASLLSLAVSYSFFILLTTSFPEINPIYIQLVAIAPASIVNYLMSSSWVFKNSP
jgi:dolichol-phosphate mannosyltransferase